MMTTQEAEARAIIAERLRRAREPHVPAPRRRTTFARQLRRIADRIDN